MSKMRHTERRRYPGSDVVELALEVVKKAKFPEDEVPKWSTAIKNVMPWFYSPLPAAQARIPST